MKILQIIPKFLIIFIVFILNSIIYPQWQQTNGITGGYFRVIGGQTDNLLTITSYGTVFKYSDNQWTYRSTMNYADEVFYFQNKWIGFNNNNIILSEDDGLSWQNIITVPPSSFIIKSKIVDNTIYALTNDSLYSTEDFGVTWLKRAIGTSITAGSDSGTLFIHRSFYANDSIMIASGFTTMQSTFLVVAYSSDFGQTWIAGNFPDGVLNSFVSDIQYDGSFYYLANERGFFKSIDGIDWVEMNDGLPVNSGSVVSTKFLTNNGGLIAIVAAPDHGLYSYDGNIWSLIYDGSYLLDVCIADKNIFFSAAGEIIKYDQTNFQSITTGLVATTSKPITSSNGNVFTVYQSKLYRTTDTGNSWNVIREGASGVLVTNDNTLFSVSSAGVLRSVDNGDNWTAFNSGIPSTHIPKVSSVGLANGKVYAGVSGTRSRTHLPPVWEQGGVYVSSNNGETWSSLNSGLPQEGGVPAPVFQSYAEGSIVIIYTIAGRFSLINNSWINIGTGFPANTHVTNTTIYKDNIIFITTNGLFISYDKGVTKEEFNSGLTITPYYSTLLFTYQEDLYLLYTDSNEIYKFENDQWNEADLQLPQDIRFMSISSVGDLIYAGTYDNGIWKFDPTATSVDDVITPALFSLEQNYPNPFNPTTTISWQSPVSSWQVLKVFDVLGKEVATLVDEYRPAGRYEINFDASRLASGVYLYKIQAGNFIQTKKMLLVK